MSESFFKFISRSFLITLCAGAILVFFGVVGRHDVFAGGAMVCCSQTSECASFCSNDPACSYTCTYDSDAEASGQCASYGYKVCNVTTEGECDVEWGTCGEPDENDKCWTSRFCPNGVGYQISSCNCETGEVDDGDDDSCVPSWGACSVSCGGGTQTDGCGNTRACNTQPCPPTIADFYIAKSLINMDKNATYTMNEETHIPFYIVLAMQMHIHKLPIKWLVLDSADTCTASCTYVDKQGVRLPDGAGQANDCQWHGTVNKFQGTQEVQPQHQGIVTYTLKCSNAYGSDTKTFQVGVKLFSWREVLRSIRDSASQFTTDTQFGFASVLDAIRARLSPGR